MFNIEERSRNQSLGNWKLTLTNYEYITSIMSARFLSWKWKLWDSLLPNCGFWNILLENFNRYGIEKGLINHICLGNTVFYILSWKSTVHMYKWNNKYIKNVAHLWKRAVCLIKLIELRSNFKNLVLELEDSQIPSQFWKFMIVSLKASKKHTSYK